MTCPYCFSIMWLDFLGPTLGQQTNKQTILPHPHLTHVVLKSEQCANVHYSCRNRIFVLTEEPFSSGWWKERRWQRGGTLHTAVHRSAGFTDCFVSAAAVLPADSVLSTHSNYSMSVRWSYAAPKLMSSDVFLNADGMITNCFVLDSSVMSGWQLQRCLSGKHWEKKKKCCFWSWNTMGGGRSSTREAGRLKVM